MPDKIRFRMLGGFLGAGKTTTISQIARHYQAQGLNVGIVTNDQAAGLVDTQLLQSQGFDVGEVAGACFCCSFNQLTETIQNLSQDARPDVVLAEPVGSCTDLVATVAQPLMQMFDAELSVGPFAVILKPSHGRKILGDGPRRGFSPQAEYIFRKQLEEADYLIINRIDELSSEEVDHLEQVLRTQFPDRPIFRLSAKTGEGMPALLEALEAPGRFCRRILDIDYDIYAAGEADLGWLNANVSFEGPVVDLDSMLLDLIGQIKDRVTARGAETAHLKIIGQSEGVYAVANVISSDSPIQLSLPSRAKVSQGELVINARIATSPAELESDVRQAVQALQQQSELSLEITSLNCLQPGRPVPTHRMSAPTND